jgi:hypothetical protein
VVGARELHEHQAFSYAGRCGNYGFLEDYTAEVRGVHLNVVVTVTFNEAGRAQQLVVNHRPRAALLYLSRLMGEKFAGPHCRALPHQRFVNRRTAKGLARHLEDGLYHRSLLDLLRTTGHPIPPEGDDRTPDSSGEREDLGVRGVPGADTRAPTMLDSCRRSVAAGHLPVRVLGFGF